MKMTTSKRSGKCLHPNAPRNVLLCKGKRRGQVAPPFFCPFFALSFNGHSGAASVPPPPFAGVVRHYCAGCGHGVLLGDISYACVKRGVIQNETGVNWRKIKAEYIAGGISQHKIADKYGVPFGTLQKRARVEQWTAKRKAAEEKAVEKVSQKTAEIVADNATIAEQIKTKLLRRLSDMVDGFPATKAGEMRVREENTELIYRLKDLAAVYNSLTADMQKAGSVDVEDLAPLVELLKG